MIVKTLPAPEYLFNDTTCSKDAFRRGEGQMVVGFSFYGSPNSSKERKIYEEKKGLCEITMIFDRF